MKKPFLACIGDLMLDVVIRSDATVERGSDVPGTVRFRLGGSAGNTARAFVALGGDASFIGAVGDDPLGKRLVAALRGTGVIVHAQRVSGATPRLAAIVTPGGERSFVTERGVADELRAATLKRGWFARVGALHMPAYSLLNAPLSQASLAAAKMVRERGGLVSVDLASRAPLIEAGIDNALRAVRAAAPDVLLANEDEVSALVGGDGARQLVALAPVVAIKMGALGCHVLWRGRDATVLEMDVATRPLAAVDTTGAGDAFDAGFIHALLVSGLRGGQLPGAPALKRAALTGHRAAAGLLTRRRPELKL